MNVAYEEDALFNYQPQATRQTWHSRFAKRTLDIFASLLGLLILAPLFVWVAWRIKRESPGPVFFRGRRMGKGGKEFGILKFRTMYERPESYAGPLVTAQGDSRITPLGSWLRDTKLNELPQLWNVLIGEMSLVGPRPEDPEIVSQWPEDAQREILSVRPGITSPASVSYHDEEKRLSSDNLMGDYLNTILPDKLRLDILYVRHHTFMTDLDAVFWTLIVLLPRISRPKSEGMLFGGPFTRLSRRYLSWTVIDFFVALSAIAGVALFWRTFQPLNIGVVWIGFLAVGMALQFQVANIFLGLHRVEWSRAVPEDIAGLFMAGLAVFILNSSFDIFFPFVNLPNGFVLAVTVVTIFSFVLARYRLRLFTGFASRWVNARRVGYGVGERALVIGAGAGGEIVTWMLRRSDFRGLVTVVGYVDDSPQKQGMRYDGHPVLGTTADIPRLIAQHDIGILFYAINKVTPIDRARILSSCRKASVPVILLEDIVKNLQVLVSSRPEKEKNIS